jgi:hypothetical protein
MIEILIHYPAARFVAALLALIAGTFIINRLGLSAWVAWINQHERKPKHKAAGEYWRVHR